MHIVLEWNIAIPVKANRRVLNRNLPKPSVYEQLALDFGISCRLSIHFQLIQSEVGGLSLQLRVECINAS